MMAPRSSVVLAVLRVGVLGWTPVLSGPGSPVRWSDRIPVLDCSVVPLGSAALAVFSSEVIGCPLALLASLALAGLRNRGID